jgi:hypothetical protein
MVVFQSSNPHGGTMKVPMKMHLRTVAGFAGWMLVFCSQLAGSLAIGALNGQLLVELDPSTSNLRTAAPLDMTWNVQWLGKSILEGHFDFEVRVGSQAVVRCQSHDVVLPPGEQRIRIRVPSPGSQTFWTQPEIHLKLVTKDETLNVGTYLIMGRPGYRAFTLCVCQGDDDRTRSHEDELVKSLHLEGLVSDNFPVKLNTTTTHWNRDDVPTSPLRFCAFDIVVATREGFVKLRAKQLDALDRWVRAGGSLCVLVGEELPADQLDYLNGLASAGDNLAGAKEGGPVFLSDGMVSSLSQQEIDRRMWLSSRGLGRVAVVNAKIVSESIAYKMHLRRIACHLWNVRQGKVDVIVANKILGASLSKNELARQEIITQQQMALANQSSISGGGHLVNCLLPRNVRVVPLGLIATILIGYVVVIGPVDYFVLGFFNLRRWTWFTFPLVTLATTILCVRISHSYLSSQDTGYSLTVRDVDANGHLVRENRFQMVFTSTRREVTTSVQQELFTAMDHQRLDMMRQRTRYAGAMSSMGVELPLYQGRFPVDFNVTQTVPQWTPLLYRTLSIPKEDQKVAFPWDRAKGLLTTDSGRQKLVEIVHASLGPQATATVLNRDLQFQLHGGRAHPGNRVGNRRHPRALGEIEPLLSGSIVSSLTIRPALGLYSLISRVSSHGGNSFEDLAMLDPSDPNQWLLLITFNRGNDLVVLRRLYTGGTP